MNKFCLKYKKQRKRNKRDSHFHKNTVTLHPKNGKTIVNFISSILALVMVKLSFAANPYVNIGGRFLLQT